MKHTVLCGHTGSDNRGCEAIIKSTADLLVDNGFSMDIATYNPAADREAGLHHYGQLLEYQGYTRRDLPVRAYNVLARRVFGDEMPGEHFRQKNIYTACQRAGSAVVVGGDTYCYERHNRVPNYCLNQFAQKEGIRTVLWSCSINEDKIDAEMVADLNRYAMIFPREQLTYRYLLEAGIAEEKLCRVSDSAFVLKTDPIDLPEDFTNVFAYNPSFMMDEDEDSGEMVVKNRLALLRYILKETDMRIALIPHVFREDFGDLVSCRELAKELNDPTRVMVLDGNYRCGQLKAAIGRCRMLFAERTHASIAGYSQCVPTFVLGYSVKSLGIATDLFGTTEHRVIPREALTEETTLLTQARCFMDDEETVRRQLTQVMPAYTQMTRDGAATLCSLIGG